MTNPRDNLHDRYRPLLDRLRGGYEFNNSPVTPWQLMELSRSNPLLFDVLNLFLNGRHRWDEVLAIAVKALVEQNQKLQAIAEDLVAKQPPQIPTGRLRLISFGHTQGILESMQMIFPDETFSLEEDGLYLEANGLSAVEAARITGVARGLEFSGHGTDDDD